MKTVFILVLFFLFIGECFPQYFGRNKPSYRGFEYQLYQSPNFDLYHYFEDDSIARELTKTYEKWYLRHQRLFKDSFDVQNPILIYENHPDFQQTTAISGAIGIGTHGVTEALRRRVAMPVLMTNAQTDHVIGHELVHVFHFRAMFEKDSLGLNSLRNLPLWLVEGMAEYFSIGSVDAHTAMIMRDAIHQDDFPSLKDMTKDYSYNPYRFGHSFVAFFGRTWGDSLIVPLFRETAKYGYERAISRVVGLNAVTVSNIWKSSMETHYEKFREDEIRHQAIGKALVTEDNGGHINIAPSLSPDGKYFAFFSEKDLFSIDLFLADAETGNIVSKLTSSTRSADIDGFNFFESVATWSPDSDKIAYVIVKKGRNKLVIANVGKARQVSKFYHDESDSWVEYVVADGERQRQTIEIAIPGVPALNNPIWSPDGKKIVFSGLAGGRPNLYMYNLESKEVINLTNDQYSYIHPSWSADGKYLALSTDKPQAAQTHGNPKFHFNLAIMDMTDGSYTTRVLDVFPNAENLNPLFTKNNEGLYFLSNSDGYRNLYYYGIEEGKVFRMTDFYTGISGLTHLTPAVSISRNTGELTYSYFQSGKYFIHKADHSDFEMVEVDPFELDFAAATLPPFNRIGRDVVDKMFEIETLFSDVEKIFPTDSFVVKPYKRQFELTYIGNTGVGVATNRYGTGMSGAVSAMFSDITGENQLFTAVAVNGEIYDFGAQIGYLNQERRINWGVMASHIPYPFAYINWKQEVWQTEEGEQFVVDNIQYIIERIFEDQVSVFAYYPFSVSRRLEIGARTAWYYYRVDAINNYYIGGVKVREDRERLDTRDGFNMQRINLAFVEDNSYFGIASPWAGQRYRIGVEKLFGEADMYSLVLDYRRYFQVRPFTFAFRTTHYGRYGREPERLFYPQFLGYMGYVRGYDFNSLYKLQNHLPEDYNYDQLLGSRVILGGVEIRFPFTGPERIALIRSRIFFTELNLFLDAGVAWSKGQSITLNPDEMTLDNRFPVFSTGASVRINLFGALILEPFLAFPFQADGFTTGVTGLNFIPGW